MRPATPHRPLIALLRDSTRVVALVLALFLGGIAANVACADHDLADMGIGEHQSHMPAPDGSPAGNSAAHVGGHCCHAGGLHAPALPTTVALQTIDSSGVLNSYHESVRPSALDQRELRPPIL